jgi:hypothetical protein
MSVIAILRQFSGSRRVNMIAWMKPSRLGSVPRLNTTNIVVVCIVRASVRAGHGVSDGISLILT